MRASDLLAIAVRLMDKYMSAEWYEQIHMSFPPPPYRESLHPRKDYQQRPYWLRTRSNPFQTNYH